MPRDLEHTSWHLLSVEQHLQKLDSAYGPESCVYHCTLCDYSTKARLNLVQHSRSARHQQNEGLRKLQLHQQGLGGDEDGLSLHELFHVKEVHSSQGLCFFNIVGMFPSCVVVWLFCFGHLSCFSCCTCCIFVILWMSVSLLTFSFLFEVTAVYFPPPCVFLSFFFSFFFSPLFFTLFKALSVSFGLYIHIMSSNRGSSIPSNLSKMSILFLLGCCIYICNTHARARTHTDGESRPHSAECWQRCPRFNVESAVDGSSESFEPNFSNDVHSTRDAAAV